MAAVQRSTSIDGFTIVDPQTWLPVYGLWCGPGWSAGQRNADLTVQQMQASDVFRHADGSASVIDEICKAHDIAYKLAEGQPNEAALIGQADVQLLRSMAHVDFNSLPMQEKAYALLMTFTFYQKLLLIDIPRAGVEAIWAGVQEIAAWIDSKLEGLSGAAFTDIFGQTMVGSMFGGNAEGLVYAIKSVTSTKPDGHNTVFTYYRDGYQSTYSAYDSAFDPMSQSAYLKRWIDGTITLIEGLRQVQLSTPSASGTPQPPIGSVVIPVPGTGVDPSEAQFEWNGLYVFDGSQWTRGGNGDFEAWVCVDHQCTGVPRNAP